MKKLILLTCLLIITLSQAQSVEYTLGNYHANMLDNFYLKDNNNLLNKFVGTWKFEQNGNSLEITLQKVIKAPIGDSFQDELQGTFVYKQNNIEIVNTNNLPLNDTGFNGNGISNVDPNKIKLYFSDPGRPKVSCVVYLTYSSDRQNVEKLGWKLIGVALLPFEENEVAPTNIRVIKDCVLIK
jgi:hypothetical protein